MKDIAAACGVSVATVSKALNDHTDVSEVTKKNVRSCAREMGYYPNSVARALKTNKTYNIGVLFAEGQRSGLTHDFFAHVLDSFKRAVEEKGYDITFLNCNKSRPNPMSYLEHSKYRGFDGIVAACVNFEDPNVQQLLCSDLPMVVIDCECEGKTCILSDNEAGIGQLMDLAHDLGHKRIAYVTGRDYALTQKRVGRYKEKLREFGIPIREEYIITSEYRDIERTAAATQRLLALPEIPTCILFPDDYAAYGGINAIGSKGMKIPKDLSVAGYDGISLASQIRPRLTTIRQDTERIGACAAQKLIDIIEKTNAAEPETILIPVELVKGETLAKNPET